MFKTSLILSLLMTTIAHHQNVVNNYDILCRFCLTQKMKDMTKLSNSYEILMGTKMTDLQKMIDDFTFERDRERALRQASTKGNQEPLVGPITEPKGSVTPASLGESEMRNKIVNAFREHKSLGDKWAINKPFQDTMKKVLDPKISEDDAAKAYLTLQEDIKPTIYNDAGKKKTGKATIGKGHLITTEELVNVYLPKGVSGGQAALGRKNFLTVDGQLDHRKLLAAVEQGAEVKLNLPQVGTVRVSKDRPLSDKEMILLGKKDYQKHKEAVQDIIKRYGLNPTRAQKVGLLALAYNAGPAFDKEYESLGEALREKNFDKLADEITQFTASNNKHYPGLLKNRMRLQRLFREN